MYLFCSRSLQLIQSCSIKINKRPKNNRWRKKKLVLASSMIWTLEIIMWCYLHVLSPGIQSKTCDCIEKTCSSPGYSFVVAGHAQHCSTWALKSSAKPNRSEQKTLCWKLDNKGTTRTTKLTATWAKTCKTTAHHHLLERLVVISLALGAVTILLFFLKFCLNFILFKRSQSRSLSVSVSLCLVAVFSSTTVIKN